MPREKLAERGCRAFDAVIVDIQMRRLMKLLADRKITLKLDDKARDWLAAKGWDPAYGARPLKRAIQRAVQDPLAEMILSGRVHDGETVTLSATDEGLTFNGQVAKIDTETPPVPKNKLN